MRIVDYKIVVSNHASFSELRAASFLRDNIRLVCGKTLSVVKESEEPTDYEIVVGSTSRERLSGILIPRYDDGAYEYIVSKVGERLFLSGLGLRQEEPPYKSAYKVMNDGHIGTVFAAYHFVEKILGYDFIYSPMLTYKELPELEMPKEYGYEFTRESLKSEMPQRIDGAAIYSLNCTERLDWNIGSFIIKTRENKLIVIDGGHEEELPRLIQCLKHISGEEVPVITAWIISHLHGDHYGAFMRLTEPEWRESLVVLDVYCNLVCRDFWVARAQGSNAGTPFAYDAIMDSDRTLGARVHVVEKGERITVDEVDFDVIHIPDPERSADMNINDTSTVYKMTYDNGQTIMFLGDAEWVCNEDLVENCADLLKSDIVQVGHHGCGNVSRRCYELIDAKVYIWQCGEAFWYQDKGEGVNTHNVGLIRYRSYMLSRNIKKENIYVTIDRIHSLPLPIPIY